MVLVLILLSVSRCGKLQCGCYLVFTLVELGVGFFFEKLLGVGLSWNLACLAWLLAETVELDGGCCFCNLLGSRF